MSNQQILHNAYEDIKTKCGKSYTDIATRLAIRNLCELALDFMAAQASLIPLVSKVPGKQYVTYRNATSVARPANKALFISDPALFRQYWNDWDAGTLSNANRLQLLYTGALAPCLAMELFDKQNKKGPATYFECFVGNLVSTQIGQAPSKKAFLKMGATNVRLTMDFLYASTPNSPGIPAENRVCRRVLPVVCSMLSSLLPP